MPKATRSRPAIPFVLGIILLLVALAATNPSKEHFRQVMRDQQSLKLDVASILPIKRTNYVIASRFEIEYGIGSTVCWGAAAYVFICPPKAES
jgi:hypothetical protein